MNVLFCFNREISGFHRFKLRTSFFVLVYALLFMICNNNAHASKIEYQNALQKNDLANLSRKSLAFTYNFQFLSADSINKIIVKTYPEEALSHLNKAIYYWWMMLSIDNYKEYEGKYIESIDNTIKCLERKKRRSFSLEEKLYFIISYAFKTRLDILNSNFLQAFVYLKSCVDVLEETLGNEESFNSFYLTSGLYNYFIDYALHKYPLMKVYAIFYPMGNMDKGIEQLGKAASIDDKLVNAESIYFLMKIFLETKQQPLIAAVYAKKLCNIYPQNLMYKYFLLRCAVDLSNKLEAQKVLDSINKTSKENNQLNAKQRAYYQKIANEQLRLLKEK